MNPTDTPQTDACGFCGEHDCKPYYRPHGQECRSPLCEVTERAKKAEAEVERLRDIVKAQQDELEAISCALGTNEGHSSVDHIVQLRNEIAKLNEAR